MYGCYMFVEISNSSETYHGDDARGDVGKIKVEAVLRKPLLLLGHHAANDSRHDALRTRMLAMLFESVVANIIVVCCVIHCN